MSHTVDSKWSTSIHYNGRIEAEAGATPSGSACALRPRRKRSERGGSSQAHRKASPAGASIPSYSLLTLYFNHHIPLILTSKLNHSISKQLVMIGQAPAYDMGNALEKGDAYADSNRQLHVYHSIRRPRSDNAQSQKNGPHIRENDRPL